MSRFRLALGVPSLLAVVASAARMWQLNGDEELWGWWPLPFLLGGWLLAVALVQRTQRLDVLAYASVAGLALGLGFPPLPTWPLLAVGFAAMLYLTEQIGLRSLSLKQQLYYCFHALVLYNVIATWWVANTSLAAGFVANYLNALLMCAPWVLTFLARRHMPKIWPVAAIVFWLAFEYVHFSWQIAWPWLALGHGLASTPSLAQWYSFTGVFGGSLYLAGAGALIFLRRRVAYASWLVLPLLASLLLGYTWVPAPGEQVGEAEILAVQPNLEPHYVKFAVPERDQLHEFKLLLEQNLTPSTQLVVLPETSFGPLDEATLASAAFAKTWGDALEATGSPAELLAGLSTYVRLPEANGDPALRSQPDGRGGEIFYTSHNTAVGLVKGRTPQVYHKSKLVPGVEFLPYRKLLFVFNPLVESLGGTTAGLGASDSATVLRFSNDIRAAPAICYESLYGEYTADYVRSGANLLVVPTNDGWWDDSPGHLQHLQLGQLRAIETRRYLVQAANSGTSAFVDPWGRVLSETEYDTRTTLTGRVELLSGTSFYVKYGDLIGRVAFGSSLLLLLSLIAAIWGDRVGQRTY